MIFPSINDFGQDLNLRQTSSREAVYDAWKALRSVFGQGSGPDPAGGAHVDAPPDNLVAWEPHRRSNVMVFFPLTDDVSVRQTSKREAFCDAGKETKSVFS